LQHLLPAGAGRCLRVGAKWENGVLMVKKQAKLVWRDAAPLITGRSQGRRPSSPSASSTPDTFGVDRSETSRFA